ncbi:hypothetical protein Btru_006624 [Bulinus truncatus]|nr:hypothetical protein Btru_006624 [Bulinus truncatus]
MSLQLKTSDCEMGSVQFVRTRTLVRTVNTLRLSDHIGGVDNFTTYLSFYGADGDLTCQNKLILKRPEEGKIIVRCQRYVHVTSIEINLTTVSTFNNFHISSGVNFSLKKQFFSGRNSKEPEYDPRHVVDGNNKTCSRFHMSKSRLPYFTVLFPEPVFLQRIDIHGDLSSNLDMNVTIHYGKETDQLGSQTYRPRGDNIHEYDPTQLKKATKLTITGTDDDKTYMTLYCLPPSYGSHCEDICSIGCLDLACYNDGECYDCLPGMKGTYCLEYNYTTDNYTDEEMEEGNNDEPDIEEEDAVKVDKGHKPKVKDPFISGTDFLLMLMFSSALPTTVVIFTIYIFCKICTEETKKFSLPADEYVPRKTMQSFRSEVKSATSLKSRKSSGSDTMSTSTRTMTAVSKRLSFDV